MPRMAQASTSGNGETVHTDRFALGDVVRLLARPELTGAVVEVLEGGIETRYKVFHDGQIATYYASQIQNVEALPSPPVVSPETLHASLTALQLSHPSTQHLYSLFASRIDFVPYQFRPVLKLIQADRPRLLIADEVGVGKTIEAGLILKELQARSELRTVLVICPKPLVSERKWLDEMKRFDEQFVQLDGNTLRYCLEETHLNGVWPQQYSRSILPFSLFDEALLSGKNHGSKGKTRQRGLIDLDPPPTFDLVIVDEAHHVRNPETWAYRGVRYFCDNAQAVVLLSATPIQLGESDLFHLLHLLRPDWITTRRDFDLMSQPNPHLHAAVEAARSGKAGWRQEVRKGVDRALSTSWGRGVLSTDPRLLDLERAINQEGDEVENRLALVRRLEDICTFSTLINRTRRRDIGAFTTRKPETVTVPFTPEQASLHEDLLSLMARLLAHRHGDENLKFLLSTFRRQLASCVSGLAPLLEDLLERRVARLEFCDIDDEETVETLSNTMTRIRADVRSLVNKARSLKGPDPKLEAFRKVVQDKQQLPNNKLLVFSTFRHTLNYLVQHLSEDSVRTGLVHGDVPEDERRTLRNRFKMPREDTEAIDVLLSSEVGCEGLDYQFCDALVNYDVPWNPMRVEQRIGRLDRHGQKSPTVAIYNLITPGTVDAEIYQRCLLRIGVFRQALGGSEEILGRITREIRDIAENLELTPEEQATRLQQLSDNEIRRIQEQTRLEDEQSKFFGLQYPRNSETDVREASSFWLSPTMLSNLIEAYLALKEPGKNRRTVAGKALVHLQLPQETRKALLEDLNALRMKDASSRTWERYLKGSSPNLTLTFEPDAATEQSNAIFVTPAHALCRQAARALVPPGPIICPLAVESAVLPPVQNPNENGTPDPAEKGTPDRHPGSPAPGGRANPGGSECTISWTEVPRRLCTAGDAPKKRLPMNWGATGRRSGASWSLLSTRATNEKARALRWIDSSPTSSDG